MNATIDKIGKSLIRTGTPYVVGLLILLLAKAGFNWKPNAETFVIVSQGISLAYYAGVRWLEINVAPKFGWLLGATGAPKYETSTAGL